MPSHNSHSRVTSFHEVRLTDFRDNGSFYSRAMIMGNVNTILDYQNYEFILIVSSKEAVSLFNKSTQTQTMSCSGFREKDVNGYVVTIVHEK